MRRGTFVICILCVAAISSCARTDTTLPSDVTSALEQAITSHDLKASVAVFADDAQILPEHGPAIRGRHRISPGPPAMRQQRHPAFSGPLSCEPRDRRRRGCLARPPRCCQIA